LESFIGKVAAQSAVATHRSTVNACDVCGESGR
jgi:hypothetical protein